MSTKKVTLRTADEQEFEVEEAVARQFGTISSFLDENPDTSAVDPIPLPEVGSKALAKVIEHTKAHMELRERGNSSAEEFDREFVKGQDYEWLKEMILAANYLDVKQLLNMLNQAVADRIKNKSVEYVRRFFAIDNDFTPEEEEKLRKENEWAFEGVDADDDF